jgi:hypothetical protein
MLGRHHQGFSVVTFKGTHPRGERRSVTLEQFVDLLTTPHRAYVKETAPGFSPTRYRDAYRVESVAADGTQKGFDVTAPACWRSNNGVEALSALTFDLDDSQPDWARLKATQNFVVYFTTWSHTPASPRSRLVVPLAGEVPVDAWAAVYAQGCERFAPEADPSCKDPARLFWLHAFPPDRAAHAETRVIEGALYAPVDVPPSPLQPTSTPIRTSVKPGDQGDAALPLGLAAEEFLEDGAPIRQQRLRALSATRNLLARGVSAEDVVDLIWQGLARSEQEPGKRPWTRADAEAIVVDLERRAPKPLRDIDPELTRAVSERAVRRVHRIEVR